MADSRLLKDCHPRPDLWRPRWDEHSFFGRARHFFTTVNPLNLFVSSATLDRNRDIVESYRQGKFDPEMSVDELWRAKHLYDSAFHPETGEKQFLLGRMSAQVPANMLMAGGLLTFYRSFSGIIFWHWLNQSYNAFVNYTNRSGKSTISNERILVSYICATGGAVSVALGLNRLLKVTWWMQSKKLSEQQIVFARSSRSIWSAHSRQRDQHLHDALIVRRPYCARVRRELTSGVAVEDEHGRIVGQSQRVAVLAISAVVLSRVAMGVPVGVTIMNRVAKTAWYRQRKWVAAPLQTLLCGFFLLFTTPFCCAFFPQKGSLKVRHLEPWLQARIRELPHPPSVVFYNKGL